MEVVELGPDAFMDQTSACDAAGIIVINRIKPHTSFHGRYESGLMKMIAIGLGKHAGAAAIHRHGVRGLRERMPEVARLILSKANILLGLALVENAYDKTMITRAIPASQIPEAEPALLEVAKSNMPRLPVEDIDLLIVDEIGKEISGTGMDTNVIGRLRIAGEAEPNAPRIKKIFVRDLRGGSAYGIGLADVTTRRLIARADWEATRINVETSGFTLRGQLPHVVETDDEAVEWALRSCGVVADRARIVHIPNDTLHLETLSVSASILPELQGREDIEAVAAPKSFGAISISRGSNKKGRDGVSTNSIKAEARLTCFGPLRESLNCLLFDERQDGGERFRIVHGQIREHLAVEFHVRLFQSFDETAVGDALGAAGSVDTLGPEGAEIGLLVLAMREAVGQAVPDGVFGVPEFGAAPAAITFRG